MKLNENNLFSIIKSKTMPSRYIFIIQAFRRNESFAISCVYAQKTCDNAHTTHRFKYYICKNTIITWKTKEKYL